MLNFLILQKSPVLFLRRFRNVLRQNSEETLVQPEITILDHQGKTNCQRSYFQVCGL